MKRAYITSSIPYVNGDPHIGHALELVQCDALTRVYRTLGYDTYFLTGSDENAQKNVESAEKAGVEVKEFVTRNAKRFEDLKSTLSLSNDQFIRTSSEKHIRGARTFWEACKADIYKKKYSGLYCVGCEAFYIDGEFPGNICPNHNRKLELVTEENYFFALSRYEKQIREVLATDMLKIAPHYRKGELLNFVNRGLEDFSISRPTERMKGWGIPVPEDDSQRMYVWFDALTNYLTALDFDRKGELFDTYWNNNPKRVHVIGKDIMKFHAIYWIGMLLSAQVLLPTHEYIHGFISSDGQKMSKSLGNVIDPGALVQTYGSDVVRYYLLKEIPALDDGDFSVSRMGQLYDADLANGLGNLLSRITTLASQDGISIEEGVATEPFEDVLMQAKDFQFHLALERLWNEIKTMNKAINEVEPWKLSSEKRKDALISWLITLQRIGKTLTPFTPETGEKVVKATSGTIQKIAPLFPRLKA